MSHYETLLQNTADIITKCDSYFITKCDRSLFQNASGFLLQITTALHKMRQLLQIATVHDIAKTSTQKFKYLENEKSI